MEHRLKRIKKLSLPSDRISCLPDEILEIILTRIPIQEAVRTCILSRKWRFMWRQIPKIVVDGSFCKKLTTDKENELFMNIRKIILLHNGSILKFKLSISRLQSSRYVNRVINYSVLKKGVKDFSYKGHKLPLPFFSYNQLEHVSLYSCLVLPPLGFKGFDKLVSLKLYYVSITTKACSSMISSCPLLQKLVLEYLSLGDQLDIDARNLRLFECAGSFVSIHFKNTPRLVNLSMFINNYGVGDEKEQVVLYNEGLPALQFLELGDLSLKYMVVALMDAAGTNRPAHELQHLNVLKLNCICIALEVEASPVFSIIRSCRKLEKLIITSKVNMQSGQESNCESFDIPDIPLDHLKEVEIQGLNGTEQELTFIEYILGNAPKLLNMVIVAYDLELVAMVTQFQRKSHLAQITFNWPFPR